MGASEGKETEWVPQYLYLSRQPILDPTFSYSKTLLWSASIINFIGHPKSSTGRHLRALLEIASIYHLESRGGCR